MTDEEWRKVEEALKHPPFGCVKMEADGYKLTITFAREQAMKYCLAVYVDNAIKVEWAKGECEISRKFYRKSTRRTISKAELKKIGMTEKQYEKIMGRKNEYDVYLPYWGSFARLKSHLQKNNNNLTLVTAKW